MEVAVVVVAVRVTEALVVVGEERLLLLCRCRSLPTVASAAAVRRVVLAAERSDGYACSRVQMLLLLLPLPPLPSSKAR